MRSTSGRTDESEPRRPVGRLRLTTAGLTWAAVAFLLGGIGWYKSLNLVLVLAYGMAVLLVMNGLLARAHVRRIEATRIPLPPVFAGEETRITLRVRNAGTRAATVGINDVATQSAGWFLDNVPGGESAICSTGIAFPRRGRFAGEQPYVWSGYPFGFVQYERRGVKCESALTVLPAVGTANAEALRRWLQRQTSSDGRARKVLRRVTSEQADVRGVRPFRPGDNIRAIHWRSTARRRELLVCEYDTTPTPELFVVVEPWLPLHPTEREHAVLEAQLSLATTVIWTWARTYSSKVTLAIAAEKQMSVWSAAGMEELIRETLSPLADLNGTSMPQPPEPDAFDRSIVSAARVLITTRRDSPLLASLTRTTGRVFVVLEPGQQLPWYQAPPDDANRVKPRNRP